MVRALRRDGLQHPAQAVEAHCERWGVGPREACRTLRVRLTPLFLRHLDDARDLLSVHREWQRVEAIPDVDARSKARWRLMTSGSSLVPIYMAG